MSSQRSVAASSALRLGLLVAVLVLAAACSTDEPQVSPAEATSTSTTSSTSTSTTAAPSSTTVAVDTSSDDDPSSDADEQAALAFGEATLTFGDLDTMFAEAPANLPSRADAATSWLIARAGLAFLDTAGQPVTDEQRIDSQAVVSQDGTDPSSSWGEVQVDLHAVSLGLQDLANQQAQAEAPLPEVVCSSHILLDTEDDAAAARARVLEGELFADVARELSTGPSAPSGGDLGCSLTSRFVAEFSDGARATGVGISEPVQSQFGWHVIEVRSIGPATTEVHPEADDAFIEQAILDSAGVLAQTIWQEQLGELLALIDTDGFVDPAVGTWNSETTSVDAA